MNLSKKIALFTLISAISFNVLAAETKKVITENEGATILPTNFFKNYAAPVCKRAILYGAFIGYWAYCSPNDKGDKLADGKTAATWEPQAWKKYVDYVVAGVILYDPLKEDYKLLKSFIEPKWNALFEKLDEVFQTQAPAA